MDGRHYKNPPPVVSGPKVRVICDDEEKRFPSEREAMEYAAKLKDEGKKPCVCSF